MGCEAAAPNMFEAPLGGLPAGVVLKLKLDGGFACGVVVPLADLEAPLRFWKRPAPGADDTGVVLLPKMLLVFLFCMVEFGVDDVGAPKSEFEGEAVLAPPKRLLLEVGAEVGAGFEEPKVNCFAISPYLVKRPPPLLGSLRLFQASNGFV